MFYITEINIDVFDRHVVLRGGMGNPKTISTVVGKTIRRKGIERECAGRSYIPKVLCLVKC